MNTGIKLIAISRKNASGGETETKPLTVNKNGTYKAPPGKAFSCVTVSTDEMNDETRKLVEISGLQTNIPTFSTDTNYPEDFDRTILKETFGDELTLRFPNANYLGGGGSFMPYSRSYDRIETPETVNIYMNNSPVKFTYNFYGSSAGLGTIIYNKGIKKFVIRCGESEIVKVKTLSSYVFRNNVTHTFDCIFDWSLLSGNIADVFGSAVENLRFKANCLSANLSLKDSFRLTADSMISVANSLTGLTTAKTLTLHNNMKILCAETYVTISQQTDETGTYDFATVTDEETDGAVTVAEFITQMKGWTIA